MTYPDLVRPACLEDAEWASIRGIVDRMERARRYEDWQLSIGSAKELCEAVAKIALETRGQAVPSSVKYPNLISQAHVALQRQPGIDLAEDPPVHDIVSSARKIVLTIGDLRKTHGTGHGRSRTPDVVAEHAEVITDAAYLWVRWALRRLDVVIEGRTVDIIRDLRGAAFSKGALARRLVAAAISELDPAEQRRLGVAVGQRAARGTFNVRIDGVDAAAGEGPWTLDYRIGILEGIFIDPDGHLQADMEAMEAALELVDLLGDSAESVLSNIVDKGLEADLSYAIRDSDRTPVVALLESRADRLPEPVASQMLKLASLYGPQP